MLHTSDVMNHTHKNIFKKNANHVSSNIIHVMVNIHNSLQLWLNPTIYRVAQKS